MYIHIWFSRALSFTHLHYVHTLYVQHISRNDNMPLWQDHKCALQCDCTILVFLAYVYSMFHYYKKQSQPISTTLLQRLADSHTVMFILYTKINGIVKSDFLKGHKAYFNIIPYIVTTAIHVYNVGNISSTEYSCGQYTGFHHFHSYYLYLNVKKLTYILNDELNCKNLHFP